MGMALEEIAHHIKDTNKKVQLIYAFNGVGKTRLSREFRLLVDPKNYDADTDPTQRNYRIIYYNAFTADLFFWDNDLDHDAEPRLKIQPNTFTDWIIRDRGQDQNIITNFQRYTDDKLTPSFIEESRIVDRNGKRINEKTYPEVHFSFNRGSERTGSVKISKGEESNFVWSVFYTLLKEVVGIIQEPDPVKRDDNQFDQLEYVFIDDPVSSLDENHLIELAVDLARLIKSAPPFLKFIITTHNPLFYNVLHNEFETNDKNSGYKKDQSKKYRLIKQEDGLLELKEQPNDHPFSYHLFLLSELKKVVENRQVSKYHFNFIRNILEKTATFLGYSSWVQLLPKNTDGKIDPFITRIINLSSHSAHAGEEIAELEERDKDKMIDVIEYIMTTYHFSKESLNSHE
jgi:wobble nucleotide-excising tRNase